MRILIVTQYFHPENFRINQLALALKESGHTVLVLTAQPNYPSGQFFSGYSFFSPTREVYDGIEVLRVPIFPRGRGRSWELVLNYLSFVFFAIFFGLPRLLGRGRFDVCISWCSSPITGAIPAIVHRFLRGTPVAIWVQDLWPETFFAVTRSKSRFLRLALASVVKWIYRNVDQIWIQSPAYTESVKAHGGVDQQIVFVPNWAEDLYNSEGWSGVAPDQIPSSSLVFAGNLGRAQGLETLIEAADLARDTRAHWVFVGDGVLKDWLASEVKRRNLESHVTLLPRRKPEEMPKVLKPAAAVLVALGGDQVFAQTIPSKVQSCLASGRPVIATLSGEPARVIQSARCGFVVPPQDPVQLAKSVKDFLEMPETERERMGQNGHAYYKAHFMQSRVVGEIERLLEEMRKK